MKTETLETDSQTWEGHCGDGDLVRVVYAHWAQKLERERDLYAAILYEAMRVVYATTCHNDSNDLIARFEALELTPVISSKNA